MHLAEKLDSEGIHGEAFNLSNEKRYTVLELVKLILKLMRREDLKPLILNEAVNEIKNQSLSAEKARKILDWKSKYDVEAGLKETIAWYKDFFGVKD
jgi:CDP-glucose 4,6-dehydratase